ncbi:class I SAM-dependent methyltransferase [Spongiactinospora sp. 9N601]|uniref:class I SAM-dependent methyltransferase n=1 Tax=Spongiactinospora sp. 9N601 TaxID=3375149 RepID=UPI0037891322
MRNASDATIVNQKRWDALAERHGRGDDEYYDVAGFLAGGSSLTDRERAEVNAAVGDVAGLELLHLQCHFGLDTLSWARAGANVTGVDFSAVAVERARRLAAEAGLATEVRPATLPQTNAQAGPDAQAGLAEEAQPAAQVRSGAQARPTVGFVQADVLALPAGLAGRFDVVFASYGVLCWIRSAAEWMASAAACLRPGGVLVLIDMHPLVNMIDSAQPLVVDFPYAGEKPVRFDSGTSYAVAGLDAEVSETVQYAHGLGEVVSAAAGAGLRVESLTEWFDEEIDPKLVRSPDGRMRFPLGDQWAPTSYGLRARRP